VTAARAIGVVVAALGCLVWLTGCETSTKLGDVVNPRSETTEKIPTPDDHITTGTLLPTPGNLEPDQAPKGLLNKDPNNDLNLGKKYFRSANFGLAERHFRRSVEQHPRDLESWVGLAASYDRLRRWDMADRAYDQAMKIAGPTPELLNNWGYSYMLRGDYRHARDTLMRAQALDPTNPFVRNNLELLEASYRKGMAVQ